MFQLIFIFLLSAQGQTLVHLKSGNLFSTQDLLQKGQILVFVEKDCSACSQYLKDLSLCSGDVKKRIHLVSTNTPAKTRDLARKVSAEFALFIFKDQNDVKSVKATPTTKWASFERIGLLKCEEFANKPGHVK